jgi:hypothetical protein
MCRDPRSRVRKGRIDINQETDKAIEDKLEITDQRPTPRVPTHANDTNLILEKEPQTNWLRVYSQGQGPARRRPRQDHFREALQGCPVLPPDHRRYPR